MQVDPYEELVGQIVAFNRAWKMAKERWGDDSALAQAARDRKSSLQADLLRAYPDRVELVVHDDPLASETLYSVRLLRPVHVGDRLKTDAEHMPVRVALQILLKDEHPRGVDTHD